MRNTAPQRPLTHRAVAIQVRADLVERLVLLERAVHLEDQQVLLAGACQISDGDADGLVFQGNQSGTSSQGVQPPVTLPAASSLRPTR